MKEQDGQTVKVDNPIDTGGYLYKKLLGVILKQNCYRWKMEHPKRAPETIDETGRFHPGENTDSRSIEPMNEESLEGRKCYTV